MKKLLLIVLSLSVLGCNLESDKKENTDPKPNPNYTGMRSVVDDEEWIEYLTGGIWTGFVFEFEDERFSGINFNALYFTESESLVFSGPLFKSDPSYIIGEFIIEENIFYIKDSEKDEYVKYAQIEKNTDLEFNKEMTLHLFIDGEKDGSKIEFDFSLTPPTHEPELLSDVVLDDTWLNKLSNTKWISENISYLEINNSTNLVDRYKVNDWFVNYAKENPGSIIYPDFDDYLVDSELPLLLEMLESDLGEKTNSIDDDYEPSDYEVTYSDEYQKILDSDYNLEISFDIDSSLIYCRIYTEEYEIANYSKEFFIIDNCIYFKELFGIAPEYSILNNADNLLDLKFIEEKNLDNSIKKDFSFRKIK